MVDVQEKKNEKKTFGPMFIPSPVVNQEGGPRKAKESEVDLDEDEDMAAAERVESYYLPPAKKARPVEHLRKASSSDVPPDTVITFDGKKVSGHSLTAKVADRTSIFDGRSSKATEFIRTRPQSVPFKGELPPLDHKIDASAPQLQPKGSLSRQLPSTKLVRQLENSEDDIAELLSGRVRRSAHHTAEHTAEQAAAMMNSTDHHAVSKSLNVASSIWLVLTACLAAFASRF